MFIAARPLVKVSSMLSSSTRLVSSMGAEVVVAGGGIVGSCAALSLARLPCMASSQVILLESSPPPRVSERQEGVFSNRVSALNPAAVAQLEGFGCWRGELQERAQPVSRMQVWDACSSAGITFQETDGQGPINYIVENDLVVESVTEEMHKCANLEVKYGSKVQEYEIPKMDVEKESVPKDKVKVRLSDGSILETDLLVGADGVKSLVRAFLGLDSEYLSWEYDQVGLVASLSIQEKGPNNTSWQRFLPSGPVALLPLSPSHSSLVWTLPKTEVGSLLKMDENEFIHLLNQSLLSQQGQNTAVNSLVSGFTTLLTSIPGMETSSLDVPPFVTGVRSRAAFPLGLGHSPSYRGSRAVLVGDSAHRVHPLAGLGANLGLGDVRELASQVEQNITNGEELGHSHYLKAYETARLRHNVPLMLGIDGLQKLYSTDLSPLVLGRALGLSATNMCRPLVRQIQALAAA